LSYKELISEKGSGRGKFIVYLNSVNFNERNSFTAKATLTWAPTEELIKSVTDENAKQIVDIKECLKITFGTIIESVRNTVFERIEKIFCHLIKVRSLIFLCMQDVD
jgi:hypothetical protein